MRNEQIPTYKELITALNYTELEKSHDFVQFFGCSLSSLRERAHLNFMDKRTCEKPDWRCYQSSNWEQYISSTSTPPWYLHYAWKLCTGCSTKWMRFQARHRCRLCAKRRSSWLTPFQKTFYFSMAFVAKVSAQNCLQKMDKSWRTILTVRENQVQAWAAENRLITAKRVKVPQAIETALTAERRRRTNPKSTKAKFSKKKSKKPKKTPKRAGQTKKKHSWSQGGVSNLRRTYLGRLSTQSKLHILIVCPARNGPLVKLQKVACKKLKLALPSSSASALLSLLVVRLLN